MTNYLQPFFNHHPYSVRSSYDVKEKIEETTFPQDCALYTMDIIQLFPSVPTEIAIDLILQKLSDNYIPTHIIASIKLALNLIIKNIFFTFQGQIYQQTRGAPMGLALSPLLAEVLLQKLETDTFPSIAKPIYYARYVDDILLIVDHEQDNFDEIYNTMNTQFPSIKLTYEICKETSIPFLDMSIAIKNGRAQIDIYHKPTSINNIIPIDSNHSYQHKWATFHSMVHRAIFLPNKRSFRDKELNNIRILANQYGYSTQHLNKIIGNSFYKYNHWIQTRVTNNPDNETATNLTISNEINRIKYIPIPYIQSLHKPLNLLLKKTNYRLAYGSSTTIESIIKKDRDAKQFIGGVYQIPFKDTDQLYIGRTKRSLETRILEHKYSLRTGNQQTALTHFAIENDIQPNFAEASIITAPKTLFLLNFTEAFEIYSQGNKAININSSVYIHPIWKDIIHKKKRNTAIQPPYAISTIRNIISITQEEDNQRQMTS